MGVEYSVTCKDCKVTRNLDKFYTSSIYPVEDRKDAESFSNKIKDDSFRAGLLVSFMAKHEGHNCVFFMEGNKVEEELDPNYENDYAEDTDFWQSLDK